MYFAFYTSSSLFSQVDIYSRLRLKGLSFGGLKNWTNFRISFRIFLRLSTGTLDLQLVCMARAVSSFTALELCITMESTTITTSHTNLITILSRRVFGCRG